MNGSSDFSTPQKKEKMIMSAKCKLACLAALAIVIAAPAFAGQRVKPTQHSAFAGAFGSSVNPVSAHVTPVQRPANNNLNPDFQLGGER
jgi:hypothetical protein